MCSRGFASHGLADAMTVGLLLPFCVKEWSFLDRFLFWKIRSEVVEGSSNRNLDDDDAGHKLSEHGGLGRPHVVAQQNICSCELMSCGLIEAATVELLFPFCTKQWSSFERFLWRPFLALAKQGMCIYEVLSNGLVDAALNPWGKWITWSRPGFGMKIAEPGKYDKQDIKAMVYVVETLFLISGQYFACSYFCLSPFYRSYKQLKYVLKSMASPNAIWRSTVLWYFEVRCLLVARTGPDQMERLGKAVQVGYLLASLSRANQLMAPLRTSGGIGPVGGQIRLWEVSGNNAKFRNLDWIGFSVGLYQTCGYKFEHGSDRLVFGSIVTRDYNSLCNGFEPSVSPFVLWACAVEYQPIFQLRLVALF